MLYVRFAGTHFILDVVKYIYIYIYAAIYMTVIYIIYFEENERIYVYTHIFIYIFLIKTLLNIFKEAIFYPTQDTLKPKNKS